MVGNSLIGKVDFILRSAKANEFARDYPSLMCHLKERMLRVCARFSKIYTRCFIINMIVVQVYTLAIAFH
jgi:hypothetical protein